MSKLEFFILEKIPYYLIVILPFFLVTGPFLSDLAISLVSLIFIYNILKNKIYKYINNFYFKFFFVFYLCIVLSSFLSEYKLYSLKSSLFYIRFIIFPLAVWYLLENNKSFLKYFLISLTSCLLLLSFDAVIQYIFKYNIVGIPIHYPGPRVSSFFGDELIMGSFIARLMPLSLVLFCKKEFFNKKIIFYLIIVYSFMEVAIFLSGERTAFFLFNISIILFLLCATSFKKIRVLIYIFSVFLIIIITIIDKSSYKRIIQQTISDFTDKHNSRLVNQNRIDSKQKIYIFSQHHNDHYLSAIKMFYDNKIFGIGPKNFRKDCKKKEYEISSISCSTHPHNTYIQLLAEVGLLGFFFIFSIFIFIAFNIVKHLYSKYKNNIIIFKDDELLLITCLFITLWPIAPSGNFFNNWLSILYFLPVGFLLNKIYK